ncbi:lysozyme-like [Wyeomyia smithii]|uniref:lysozyme-like n=1 Tax=Wyeomyia smithii TaxID=174621 RepID=UPI002467B84F|nr:lysozyme-like [Wyeomyia smithii]
MKHLVLVLAFAVGCTILQNVQAKQFTECELARLLHRTYGFDRSKTNNFVCLAAAESSLNTSKTHKNRNGSTDYGLFQINNMYWCTTPGYVSRSDDCRTACSEFLKNDISKAVACAKKVLARHGYTAWEGWKAKCRSGVKDLSSCM